MSEKEILLRALVLATGDKKLINALADFLDEVQDTLSAFENKIDSIKQHILSKNL